MSIKPQDNKSSMREVEGSRQDLPSLAIRRPVLIIVLNLLIIIAGMAALNGIEVREL